MTKQISKTDKHGFSFEEPEESAGFVLWQVFMLWQRTINAALSDLDLTHAQFVALAATGWLTRKDSLATQTDIANHAKIDKMMTSKLVRSLEEKGLVRRAEHETDTRAKTVELTEEGVSVLKKALKRVHKADADLFAPLGTDVERFAEDLRTIFSQQNK